MTNNPEFKLYLEKGYDESLAPIPAVKYKDWWDDNYKTKNHARHCLPLAMANSVGYYILSPGTFKVKWNGNVHSDVQIEHIEKSSHYEVDAHASYASFTVQPKFIPVTQKAGQFIYFKPMPNERAPAFVCMEAMIEAWWNVANFGLVFLMTKPGEFIIKKGQPIAHMLMYYGQAGAATLSTVQGYPKEHYEWLERRNRPDYKKDLDYLKGKNYKGEDVNQHLTNWKNATIYEKIRSCLSDFLYKKSNNNKI